jgi:uncharacterized membrane protein
MKEQRKATVPLFPFFLFLLSPSPGSGAWNDDRLEQVIGTLLRAGVLLSGALLVAGGMVYLARHGSEPPHYRNFAGEPSDLRTIPGIVADAVSFRGRGIIQLGLLFLIATPVVRVAFSAVAFALERDWLYVAVTSVVLAVLLFSLVGGHLL